MFILGLLDVVLSLFAVDVHFSPYGSIHSSFVAFAYSEAVFPVFATTVVYLTFRFLFYHAFDFQTSRWLDCGFRRSSDCRCRCPIRRCQYRWIRFWL